MNSTRYYNSNAQQLFEQYNSLDAVLVHQSWLKKHLPESLGLACDIGAGSGRDANWLAEKGWDVVAVEPCRALHELAQAESHARVTWLDDALPNLKKLRSLGLKFDLILLSAVWMHVAPDKRQKAFRILSDLLNPSGVLVITLRHGSDEAENKQRGFHDINADELRGLARERALKLEASSSGPDLQRRPVSWQTLVFTLPDDGTGNLPLLRHIIVNDDKSSTYKLGLLRILARIAEGSPGAVCRRTEEIVEIPLGLVGLYWIKQYKPLLLDHEIPQQPNKNQGYGFAREDFYKLNEISRNGQNLRIGASFAEGRAAVVIGAMRDACRNIVNMPVRHTTYPGQNRSVFEQGEPSRRIITQVPHVTLSLEYLQTFGTLQIPANLWDTLGHYAYWLEPAILREWIGLMEGWKVAERSFDMSLFNWDEPQRDTGFVRQRVDELKDRGWKVPCVWSKRTPVALQIDHCFPWARWPNNDLWNLLPASGTVNASKGDKLPSAPAMARAEGRIKDWWQQAWLDSDHRERFLLEAEGSLPGLPEHEPTLDQLYDAMRKQRLRLKADQRIPEWTL